MALNKPRKLEIVSSMHIPQSKEKIQQINKHRAFNRAVGPGKKSKLISLGPTFIPDNKVI